MCRVSLDVWGTPEQGGCNQPREGKEGTHGSWPPRTDGRARNVPAEGNGAHIILKDAAQERFLAKGL